VASSCDRWSGEDERGGTKEWSSCFLFLAEFCAIGGKWRVGLEKKNIRDLVDSDGGALAGGHGASEQSTEPLVGITTLTFKDC
jgi:hypothetical protein